MAAKRQFFLRRKAKRVQAHFSRRPGVIAWPVFLISLLLLGSPAGSSQALAFDPVRDFTITQIEPDAAREEVRLVFSQPVSLEALRPRLRLVPPVKIHWDKSSVSEAGVVTLRGAFKFGANYFVHLPENFTYNRRAYVKSRNTFFLPDMLPKIEFVDHKSVIERDSRQLLQVRVRNLERVRLEGLTVPPLLLPLVLAQEGGRGDGPDLARQLQAGLDELAPLLQGRSGWFGRSKLKEINPIFSAPPQEFRQLFTTRSDKNRPRAFSLPLTFRPGKETGALALLRLQDDSPGAKTVAATQLFRLTDLGLTYKIGQGGLLLWVTSMKTGAPVAGAQVLAFTRDLEVFPLGRTDADGVLTFSSNNLEGLSLKQAGRFGPVARTVHPAEITYLLAGTATDVSYISLAPQGHLPPERVWQAPAGEALKNRRGFVFTDRGVYRPGEKVSFKGTIREYRDGAITPPGVGQYRFVITSPKGEEVYAREATLSDFGSAWGEMPIPPHLPRGTYTLALKLDTGPAEDRQETPQAEEGEFGPGGAPVADVKPPQEATCTFQIQDFRPPRHFVDIAFQRFSRPEDRYVNRTGEREFVRITVSGSYYAGGPVKHGQVRWKVSTAPTSYQVKGFDDFTFGSREFDRPELLESGQAILDENGLAVIEFPLEAKVLAGRQGLAVTATVVDFDGRAVANTRDFQVEPEMFVGIGVHAPEIRAGDRCSRPLSPGKAKKSPRARSGPRSGSAAAPTWPNAMTRAKSTGTIRISGASWWLATWP